MSNHETPQKAAAPTQLQAEAGAEHAGKTQSPPSFGLTATPIQRETPGGGDPPKTDTVPAKDTQQAQTPQNGTATPTTTADPNQKFKDYVAETPADNVAYATWVLKGADEMGFVTFNNTKARTNWENIRDGKEIGSVKDPKTAPVISALPTVTALVKARVNRYIAGGFTGTKDALQLGSFMIGRDGSHKHGDAIDINGLDFATSVDKVLQVLQDLPAGTYGIGLPAQGEFFDKSKSLAEQKKAVEATGKAGDATGWEYHVTGNYKSTYTPGTAAKEGTPATPGTWSKRESAAGTALSLYMKSQKIKDQLGKMSGSFCYPDYDNHIHIDTR